MPNDQVIQLAAVGWMKGLEGTKKEIYAIMTNATLILANDPPLAGMLGYDGFRGQFLLMRPVPTNAEFGEPALPGPYPRIWEGQDVSMLLAYFQRLWGHKWRREVVETAMVSAACLNQFHPVKDYLAGLKWDGKPRIDTWLPAVFDCDNTPLNQAISAKVLIAAVRRVIQPGCKFDHMLILEGPQGIGKSRALQALCGSEWFSDSVPSDLNGKEAAIALQGVWFLEFAEIQHIIKLEVEQVKAFLSRAVDRYRPPYGKQAVDRPRQGIAVGTTNTHEYLSDATGNRRIWPVQCKTADPEWITLNRDQLWAEAVVREALGEPIWLNDELVRSAAADATANRLAGDVWEDKIRSWLGLKTETVTSDVLEGIGVPSAQMTRAAEMRVGAVLRRFGWERFTTTSKGKSVRLWRLGKADFSVSDNDEIAF